MSSSNERIAVRVSVVTIIGNIALTFFKLVAGFLGGSTAMLSDAVHSASDVLSTIVVIIGAKMAGKQADHDHHYGHERMECVAAIILATVLGITGAGIGYSAVTVIASGEYATAAAPGTVALIAAIVSIVSKEIMYHYTRAAAKKIGSGALMADAWHHRSDALSSIGSFVGILGAQMGILVLDSVAGLLISLLIIKVAYTIYRQAVDKMVDKACAPEVAQKIRDLSLAQQGVLAVDDIKTRVFAEQAYIDIEISCAPDITLEQAHDIAHTVHDVLEHELPSIKHCMVHVNPYKGQ